MTSGNSSPLPPWLRVGTPEGGVPALTIAIAVQPNAKASAVVGLHGDRLKVKVAAPPVEGAANEALLAFLRKALGVRPAQLILVQGSTGRQKVVRVLGLSAEAVAQALKF